MGTYQVTSPDGRTLELTGEKPPTEDALNKIFSGLPKKKDAYSPDVTVLDRFGPFDLPGEGINLGQSKTGHLIAGVGKGMTKAGQDVKELGLDFVDPKAAQQYSKGKEEENAFWETTPAGQSKSGKIGAFAGEFLPYMAIPQVGGATKSGMLGGGALLGTGIGGMQQVPSSVSPEDRWKHRMVGGGFGAAIGGAAPFALPAAGYVGRGVGKFALRAGTPAKKFAKRAGEYTKAKMGNVAYLDAVSRNPIYKGAAEMAGSVWGGIKSIERGAKKLNLAADKRITKLIDKMAHNKPIEAADLGNLMDEMIFNEKNVNSLVSRAAVKRHGLLNSVYKAFNDNISKSKMGGTGVSAWKNRILGEHSNAALNNMQVSTKDLIKYFNRHPEFLRNSGMQSLLNTFGLLDDTGRIIRGNLMQSPTLPFVQWKSLLSRIGEMQNQVAMGADVKMSTKALKGLYGTIKNSLSKGIKKQGGQKSLDAWNSYNKYVSEHANFMRKNFLPFQRQMANTGKELDNAFLRIFSRENMKGASGLKSMREAFPEKDWSRLVAGYIRSLGHTGEKGTRWSDFNLQAFMSEKTGFRSLGKTTKDALFGGSKQMMAYKKDLNILAKAFDDVTQGSAVLQTKGAAGIKGLITNLLVLSGAFGAGATGGGLLTGDWGGAWKQGLGTMAFVMGASKGAGWLVTNTKATQWAAQMTKMRTPMQIERHLGRLMAMDDTDPETVELILNSFGGDQSDQTR
jgi:hypothetical protein